MTTSRSRPSATTKPPESVPGDPSRRPPFSREQSSERRRESSGGCHFITLPSWFLLAVTRRSGFLLPHTELCYMMCGFGRNRFLFSRENKAFIYLVIVRIKQFANWFCGFTFIIHIVIINAVHIDILTFFAI